MPNNFRTKNRFLLSKVEGVSGVEETPVVTADAVHCENPQFGQGFDNIETDEVSASLDASDPIVGGGNVTMSLDAYLKGSGVGGTAPEYGSLLRAASFAETLTAAPVTDTAQAGDVGEITLAAGASAVDDAHKGMPVEITGGTGSGQGFRMCYGYDGTTKVALVTPDWDTAPDITSVYNFPANALYVPASQDNETVTQFLYDNPVDSTDQSFLRKLIGAAATVTLAVATRGVGKFSFNLTGILPSLPENVDTPAAPTYDTVKAPVFKDADAFLGGLAVKFRDFSFDLGGTVQQPDDPAALYGYDFAGVVARRITGTLNPMKRKKLTRDNMLDFIGGTTRDLWLRYGGTVGNRVSIYCPALKYTGVNDGDTDGFATEELPFQATGVDAGIFICFH